MSEKEYKNKDLVGVSEEDFYKQVENDFIGEDFDDQLEWTMLITQHKFKQIRTGDHLENINRNHFDKSFLFANSAFENIKFFAPLSNFQANPDIFPYINIKVLSIGKAITFTKVKELRPENKRGLILKSPHAYEYSYSFYNKTTESFYSGSDGYEVNKSFFDLGKTHIPGNINLSNLPNPIPLKKGYTYPPNPLKYLSDDRIIEVVKAISAAYQVAFSMYYEWCVYIKEYDNIGIVIPIAPDTLKEMYKTSLAKFENRKAMIHFVREHYRRKVAIPNEDYSVFVQKYLRGENKFEHNGFKAEIIPPKYDLNRIKTRKTFINPIDE